METLKTDPESPSISAAGADPAAKNRANRPFRVGSLIKNRPLAHFWGVFFGERDCVGWNSFKSKLQIHLTSPKDPKGKEEKSNLSSDEKTILTDGTFPSPPYGYGLSRKEVFSLFGGKTIDRTKHLKQALDLHGTDSISLLQICTVINTNFPANGINDLPLTHLLFYLMNQRARVVFPSSPNTYSLLPNPASSEGEHHDEKRVVLDTNKAREDRVIERLHQEYNVQVLKATSAPLSASAPPTADDQAEGGEDLIDPEPFSPFEGAFIGLVDIRSQQATEFSRANNGGHGSVLSAILTQSKCGWFVVAGKERVGKTTQIMAAVREVLHGSLVLARAEELSMHVAVPSITAAWDIADLVMEPWLADMAGPDGETFLSLAAGNSTSAFSTSHTHSGALASALAQPSTRAISSLTNNYYTPPPQASSLSSLSYGGNNLPNTGVNSGGLDCIYVSLRGCEGRAEVLAALSSQLALQSISTTTNDFCALKASISYPSPYLSRSVGNISQALECMGESEFDTMESRFLLFCSRLREGSLLIFDHTLPSVLCTVLKELLSPLETRLKFIAGVTLTAPKGEQDLDVHLLTKPATLPRSPGSLPKNVYSMGNFDNFVSPRSVVSVASSIHQFDEKETEGKESEIERERKNQAEEEEEKEEERARIGIVSDAENDRECKPQQVGATLPKQGREDSGEEIREGRKQQQQQLLPNEWMQQQMSDILALLRIPSEERGESLEPHFDGSNGSSSIINNPVHAAVAAAEGGASSAFATIGVLVGGFTSEQTKNLVKWAIRETQQRREQQQQQQQQSAQGVPQKGAEKALKNKKIGQILTDKDLLAAVADLSEGLPGNALAIVRFLTLNSLNLGNSTALSDLIRQAARRAHQLVRSTDNSSTAFPPVDNVAMSCTESDNFHSKISGEGAGKVSMHESSVTTATEENTTKNRVSEAATESVSGSLLGRCFFPLLFSSLSDGSAGSTKGTTKTVLTDDEAYLLRLLYPICNYAPAPLLISADLAFRLFAAASSSSAQNPLKKRLLSATDLRIQFENAWQRLINLGILISSNDSQSFASSRVAYFPECIRSDVKLQKIILQFTRSADVSQSLMQESRDLMMNYISVLAEFVGETNKKLEIYDSLIATIPELTVQPDNIDQYLGVQEKNAGKKTIKGGKPHPRARLSFLRQLFLLTDVDTNGLLTQVHFLHSILLSSTHFISTQQRSIDADSALHLGSRSGVNSTKSVEKQRELFHNSVISKSSFLSHSYGVDIFDFFELIPKHLALFSAKRGELAYENESGTDNTLSGNDSASVGSYSGTSTAAAGVGSHISEGTDVSSLGAAKAVTRGLIPSSSLSALRPQQPLILSPSSSSTPLQQEQDQEQQLQQQPGVDAVAEIGGKRGSNKTATAAAAAGGSPFSLSNAASPRTLNKLLPRPTNTPSSLASSRSGTPTAKFSATAGFSATTAAAGNGYGTGMGTPRDGKLSRATSTGSLHRQNVISDPFPGGLVIGGQLIMGGLKTVGSTGFALHGSGTTPRSRAPRTPRSQTDSSSEFAAQQTRIAVDAARQLSEHRREAVLWQRSQLLYGSTTRFFFLTLPQQLLLQNQQNQQNQQNHQLEQQQMLQLLVQFNGNLHSIARHRLDFLVIRPSTALLVEQVLSPKSSDWSVEFRANCLVHAAEMYAHFPVSAQLRDTHNNSTAVNLPTTTCLQEVLRLLTKAAEMLGQSLSFVPNSLEMGKNPPIQDDAHAKRTLLCSQVEYLLGVTLELTAQSDEFAFERGEALLLETVLPKLRRILKTNLICDGEGTNSAVVSATEKKEHVEVKKREKEKEVEKEAEKEAEKEFEQEEEEERQNKIISDSVSDIIRALRRSHSSYSRQSTNSSPIIAPPLSPIATTSNAQIPCFSSPLVEDLDIFGISRTFSRELLLVQAKKLAADVQFSHSSAMHTRLLLVKTGHIQPVYLQTFTPPSPPPLPCSSPFPSLSISVTAPPSGRGSTTQNSPKSPSNSTIVLPTSPIFRNTKSLRNSTKSSSIRGKMLMKTGSGKHKVSDLSDSDSSSAAALTASELDEEFSEERQKIDAKDPISTVKSEDCSAKYGNKYCRLPLLQHNGQDSVAFLDESSISCDSFANLRGFSSAVLTPANAQQHSTAVAVSAGIAANTSTTTTATTTSMGEYTQEKREFSGILGVEMTHFERAIFERVSEGFQEAVDKYAVLFGVQSVSVADAAVCVGNFYRSYERLLDAQEHYELALEAYKDHGHTDIPHNNSAVCLLGLAAIFSLDLSINQMELDPEVAAREEEEARRRFIQFNSNASAGSLLLQSDASSKNVNRQEELVLRLYEESLLRFRAAYLSSALGTHYTSTILSVSALNEVLPHQKRFERGKATLLSAITIARRQLKEAHDVQKHRASSLLNSHRNSTESASAASEEKESGSLSQIAEESSVRSVGKLSLRDFIEVNANNGGNQQQRDGDGKAWGFSHHGGETTRQQIQASSSSAESVASNTTAARPDAESVRALKAQDRFRVAAALSRLCSLLLALSLLYEQQAQQQHQQHTEQQQQQQQPVDYAVIIPILEETVVCLQDLYLIALSGLSTSSSSSTKKQSSNSTRKTTQNQPNRVENMDYAAFSTDFLEDIQFEIADTLCMLGESVFQDGVQQVGAGHGPIGLLVPQPLYKAALDCFDQAMDIYSDFDYSNTPPLNKPLPNTGKSDDQSASEGTIIGQELVFPTDAATIAEDNALRTREYAVALRAVGSLMAAHKQSAQVHLSQQEPDLARDCFESVMRIFMEVRLPNHAEVIADTQSEYARLCLRTHQPAEATLLFQQANDLLVRKVLPKYSVASRENNKKNGKLSRFSSKQGQNSVEGANFGDFLSAVERLRGQIFVKCDIAQNLIEMGGGYLEIQGHDEAQTALEDALDLLDEIHAQKVRLDAFESFPPPRLPQQQLEQQQHKQQQQQRKPRPNPRGKRQVDGIGFLKKDQKLDIFGGATVQKYSRERIAQYELAELERQERQSIASVETVGADLCSLYAATYNYLGLIHHHFEEHEEAEIAYKQAILYFDKHHAGHSRKGRKHNKGTDGGMLDDDDVVVLGAVRDSIDIANLYNNLATLYDDTGKLEEARTMYERALVILVRKHGRAHPQIVVTMENLSNLLKEIGGCEEDVAGLQENIVAIEERIIKSIQEAEERKGFLERNCKKRWNNNAAALHSRTSTALSTDLYARQSSSPVPASASVSAQSTTELGIIGQDSLLPWARDYQYSSTASVLDEEETNLRRRRRNISRKGAKSRKLQGTGQRNAQNSAIPSSLLPTPSTQRSTDGRIVPNQRDFSRNARVNGAIDLDPGLVEAGGVEGAIISPHGMVGDSEARRRNKTTTATTGLVEPISHLANSLYNLAFAFTASPPPPPASSQLEDVQQSDSMDIVENEIASEGTSSSSDTPNSEPDFDFEEDGVDVYGDSYFDETSSPNLDTHDAAAAGAGGGEQGGAQGGAADVRIGIKSGKKREGEGKDEETAEAMDFAVAGLAPLRGNREEPSARAVRGQKQPQQPLAPVRMAIAVQETPSRALAMARANARAREKLRQQKQGDLSASKNDGDNEQQQGLAGGGVKQRRRTVGGTHKKRGLSRATAASASADTESTVSSAISTASTTSGGGGGGTLRRKQRKEEWGKEEEEEEQEVYDLQSGGNCVMM